MINLILNDLSYYIFALITFGVLVVAINELKGGDNK